ncbi:D-inositol-3-phosphate glycosyltransferase [Commensalibacter sp. Nvir]|uniref:glycosyltransferase family 4 protein n=1 Tax=Commensalibacter sp. Nvir TaxID=3069817 RepID=UPI002D601052|nr:D-inositol-3-phosphate glycosyltransferase [Commensalibacter sp. Nvir]
MRIVTVLPLKEGFSSAGIGAIGLLVKRLAQRNDIIIGRFCKDTPYLKDQYYGIKQTWLSRFNKNRDYQKGVINRIKHLNPTIVEIHNCPRMARSISKIFPRIPVTLILHNDPLELGGTKKRKQRQCLINNVDIVAVSPWLKNRFLKNNVQGMVTLIPNSLDLTEIPPFRSIFEREKTILFVGRVVADKGADIFVKIGQRLIEHDSKWSIELVGADRFTYSSKETPFIKTLRESLTPSSIKFTGYLSHNKVLEKMAQASLIIVPSRWAEPFGMTALEAMACGTPLIVTCSGALPWVVGKGGIVVESENEEALYKTLLNLIYDKKKQEQLSKKALKRASQFSHVNIQNLLCNHRKRLSLLSKTMVRST